MAAGNPLYALETRIPFGRIHSVHVVPAIRRLLEQARLDMAELARGDGSARTFENTLARLDALTAPLDEAMSVVRHLESAATTPELRAAYNAVEPEVSAFYSSIPLNHELWLAVKAVAQSEDARSLDPTERRFLDKTVEDFRRHGADLDAAGKARLQESEVELSRLTTKFSENVLDATNEYELLLADEQQLAGLPPSAVAAARQSAQAKGKPGWRFTLQAPSYVAIQTYLRDPRIREQTYRAFSRRAADGAHDNRPLIERILELRREKARLLGYWNFADLILEDRMAKRGAMAREFLEELRQASETRFEQENAELAAFRQRREGDMTPLQPWDVAYYAELQRKELFDFDEEQLRPFFPMPRVIAGLFRIAERLFGIRVSERPGVPVWDKEVRCYDIHDEGGKLAGSFYTDWYPRENKRGGAWMESLITGGPRMRHWKPHVGVICGNLTPPIGDKPALLTHREVETIFHEFGHLLHHCLSRVRVRSLAGTNVAWDFVELPSQIMENWCWEREALDLFARHWQTDEPIPEELFAKMKRARNYRAANAMMRQLGFGLLDLALHTDFDARRYREQTGGTVLDFAREQMQRFSPAPLPGDYAMLASFTHLFAGPVAYGAGYYSYKWAEVLDADAFGLFREKGIFDPGTGRAFREWILARGNSDDPAQLFRGFMGRDPNVKALLLRAGLLALH